MLAFCSPVCANNLQQLEHFEEENRKPKEVGWIENWFLMLSQPKCRWQGGTKGRLAPIERDTLTKLGPYLPNIGRRPKNQNKELKDAKICQTSYMLTTFSLHKHGWLDLKCPDAVNSTNLTNTQTLPDRTFDIQVKDLSAVQVFQRPQRLMEVVQGQILGEGGHLFEKLGQTRWGGLDEDFKCIGLFSTRVVCYSLLKKVHLASGPWRAQCWVRPSQPRRARRLEESWERSTCSPPRCWSDSEESATTGRQSAE